MADEVDRHPFVSALPPTTDYITYLTLLEYNLDSENVRILQDVLLQDSQKDDSGLIINIGWDLVALLLPLLPASQESLILIARYGNPREVVLKVAEAFESIQWELESHEVVLDQKSGNVHDDLLHPALRANISAASENKSSREKTSLEQFTMLSTMLGILHRRIRTKRPSRFAATTLGTVLSAFDRVPITYMSKIVKSLVQLITTMDGRTAPLLPPRNSPNDTNGAGVPKLSAPKAPDPEAEATTSLAADDTPIHRRLLQSFITHLTAHCLEALGNAIDADELPGLAWAPKELEKYQPKQTVPGRTTWRQQFEDDESLRERQVMVQSLQDTAKAFEITQIDLLKAAGSNTESTLSESDGRALMVAQSQKEWIWNEDLLPQHPDDIQLSSVGCLHLLAAMLCTPHTPSTDCAIFPQHSEMLQHHIASGATSNTANLDALLGLAIRCLTLNTITPADATTSPPTDVTTSYLRQTATLSATSSSPSLRFAAHTLTTTILRSCPSDALRLAFIRSILEENPYTNLRVSAVGWLKGCIVDANMDLFTHVRAQTRKSNGPARNIVHGRAAGDTTHVDEEAQNDTLFTTSLALIVIGPFLFSTTIITSCLEQASQNSASASTSHALYDAFAVAIPCYLTTLNFYYFLHCAPTELGQRLDLNHVHKELKVAGYLKALQDIARIFGLMLSDPEPLETAGRNSSCTAGPQRGVLIPVMGGKDSEYVQAARAELGVLEERVERVRETLANPGL